MYLELHNPKFESVVLGKALSAPDGKFFLKANEGEYRLDIKKITETGEKQVVGSTQVVVNKNGLVNIDVVI